MDNENDVIDEVSENEAREEVAESQEQVKTYTEDEVNAIKEQMKADNQKAWDKRWGREKSKLEKQYEKKDQIIELLNKNMKTDNIDDLEDKIFAFYQEEKPTRVSNPKDDEILGKYDAKEILELEDDLIEEEANRLAGLNRTAREEATFMELR